MANVDKTVAVVGHPLAAPENRAAFAHWRSLQPRLIAPQVWPARNLGVTYAAPIEPPSHLRFLPCRWPGRNAFFWWRGLEPALDAWQPALLYCWEEPWCLSAGQACRWAARRGIPFVFYSAENRPKSLPPPFRAVLRYVAARARACVVPTADSAANVKRLGFSGPALVVPLWLAPRAVLHPDFAGKTLAYVGRLIPLKRVDLLIAALPLLPEFRLRLLGDGPERLALASLAERLGVAERVRFLGYVPHPDLEAALAGCACLLLPTAANTHQAEQFGKAALEGVLCGLPVIVARSGQLPGWAEALETVSCLEAWSPEAVRDAVRRLWENPPAAEKLAAAREWVAQRFSASAVGAKLESALQNLLEPAP